MQNTSVLVFQTESGDLRQFEHQQSKGNTTGTILLTKIKAMPESVRKARRGAEVTGNSSTPPTCIKSSTFGGVHFQGC